MRSRPRAARFAQHRASSRCSSARPTRTSRSVCAATRVVCLDRMRSTTLDEAGVRREIRCARRIDPGLPRARRRQRRTDSPASRVGARSPRRPCSARTDSSRRFPTNLQAWSVKVRGAAVLADNLRAGRADAELFRTLATLRFDAPLTESLDDLRWKGPDVAALTKLAARLGDPQLVEQARKLAV